MLTGLAIVGVSDTQAQFFNPDLAVPLSYSNIPTNITITYFFLSGSGPLPFIPTSDTNDTIYWDSMSYQYFVDDSSGGGFALDDPAFPGPGGGATNDYTPDTSFNQASFIFSYTTKVWQYTKYWLQISSDSTSNTQVTVVDTIPGLFYQVQTNSNLLSTNWIPWTNLLASTQNTPAPLLNLGTNQVFFRGKVVLPGGSLLTNGLVAYWKMNDASGTNAADSSGYGNTLSLVGSPYWGPASLILDGSTQYGDASSSTLTNLDNHDKTICAWIYKTNANFVGIVDKTINADNGGWGFWDTGTNLAWRVSDANGYYVDSGPQITPLNQWVFTSVVWYATNKVEFFLNGLLNSYSTVEGAEAASGSADLEVGNLIGNLDDGSYCFGGYIRDVAICNRALQPSEIASNCLSSQYITDIPYPDLLYYKLNTGSSNESSPQTAFDSSTIGTNTGTIYGINGSDIEWTNGITRIPDDTNGLNGPNNYGALHFHGAGGNYIDTGNSNLFQFTTNLFTINFWVAPYTAGETIMQCGVFNTNGWYIQCGGSYQIVFDTETNGVHTPVITGSGSSGAQVNTWTMVTVVRTSLTNATIYINGLPAASGPIAVPAPSSTTLQIGITPGATASSFDGDLWGIQIWSLPLTQVDIANLYLETLGTSNAVNYP